MNHLLSQIKTNALFADFPDEIIIKHILPHKQLIDYRKGQFIIEPQQTVNRFGIVLSGKIHIMHLFSEGNYSLMTVLSPGKLLGADLICTRSQIAPYHGIAATAVSILYLPADLLTKPGLLPDAYRFQALQHLLTLISQENMKKEYRLAILSQKGLRERIITYLSMQAARLHKNTFTIPFSREELAAFLCVNRSALSHELSLMKQEGLITFRKNEFTIHKL